VKGKFHGLVFKMASEQTHMQFDIKSPVIVFVFIFVYIFFLDSVFILVYLRFVLFNFIIKKQQKDKIENVYNSTKKPQTLILLYRFVCVANALKLFKQKPIILKISTAK